MTFSTLKQIADNITIEQLNIILDKIELHPNQRRDMKKEALYYGAHDFILTNEGFVVMNNNEFEFLIK